MRIPSFVRLPLAVLAVLALGLTGSLGVDGYLARSSAYEASPVPSVSASRTSLPTWLPVSASAAPLASAAPTLSVAPVPAPDAPVAVEPAPAPAALSASDWASQPYTVGRGPNLSDKVVLSYDDCPKSQAVFKEVVLGAESLHVALALFPTAPCLASGVFDADFARAHGHYVFNHSVSHPHFARLDQGAIEGQLGAPGVQTTWGRPPYGELTPTIRAAYAAKGMRIWTWTVDTNDWRGAPAPQIVAYVVGQARAGDSVLMHMQHHAFDRQSLSQMVSGLAARGLGVCANSGPTEIAPRSIVC